MEDVIIGERSGVAFLVDQEHGNRKILLAVRKENRDRNNYYDGPFDQLADNHNHTTALQDRLIRANPNLTGRIDRYGYFTDSQPTRRVVIDPYYHYSTRLELLIFAKRARKATDTTQFIPKNR